MIFFNLPKPRRFHHEYIYVDERKERLNKLKEQVKLESEGEKAMEANDRKISFDFHSERNTRQKANNRFMTIVGIAAVLTILAVLLIVYFM
ncbi:hypothetical protein CBG55_04220 [Prevotella intermedia]|jgi:hypothetical protein|uniref:Ubiquitin carboxyl-hydrolase n=1 Tax=Prevotella intermedia TaxID=28131 RepID=A0A2M8TN10_PREIN|nr:hypothetical protein [Prevotella intermedia]OWP33400.1 hypothetical protein CBG55_04220 [Prevotella intermedia]PJI25316.1 hypothetical protein CTM59_04220 [Prevotella intermedia]